MIYKKDKVFASQTEDRQRLKRQSVPDRGQESPVAGYRKFDRWHQQTTGVRQPGRSAAKTIGPKVARFTRTTSVQTFSVCDICTLKSSDRICINAFEIKSYRYAIEILLKNIIFFSIIINHLQQQTRAADITYIVSSVTVVKSL